MRAVVTVGLGFGDEGKGATVDHLVRETGAALVVRYSGGAQAGHNVVLPDGRRHSFAQFGAGTFAGARTWLGPRMVLSPSTLEPEAAHLRALGVADPFATLEAHPDCLVSTLYHVCMNRLREVARGGRRHGSCGLGIGETRSYWLRHGAEAVVVQDLRDRAALVRKLTLLRDRFLLDLQELGEIESGAARLLYETPPAREADVLMKVPLRMSRIMPKAETVIFEGAQGILLDEYWGFHPHTTWSTVTALHALELAEEAGIEDVEVLGVTRAYATRHGAGPLPTYCPRMTAALADPGNPANAWQGSLRAGPLDLVLLRYAMEAGRIDGLVVNGLDQLTETRVCRRYAATEALELPRTLREQEALTRRLQAAEPVLEEVEDLLETLEELAPVRIAGRGPSHLDRKRASVDVRI